jgi:prephenate dehydrogenase
MAPDTNSIFNLPTIVIVGPGLLGGSVALGLKAAGHTGKVIGVARSQSTLDIAQQVGCIDQGTSDLIEAAKQADMILLATPLKTFRMIMGQMRDHLKPTCIITDVGSTKSSVLIDAHEQLKPEQLKYLVPSHPMAGSETQGPAGASAQMLKTRPCIVTPLPENDPVIVNMIKDMWDRLGMQVIEMTPKQHDEHSAVISHLPHLLNVMLVQTAMEMGGMEMASTGFKGATRLASSNPTIRCDILTCNRTAILNVIEGFEQVLATMKNKIDKDDREGLLDDLNQAMDFRNRWVNEFDHRGDSGKTDM